MNLVARCMSTQHPDNVASPPFADDGVLKGEGEIAETVHVFRLGCDEQMWDSEGKDVDTHVVQKMLGTAPEFFRDERRLGRDCVVTLRVPNPAIERDMRKSLVARVDRVHQGLTTAVRESLRGGSRSAIPDYVVAAASLRRFLE